MAKPLPLVLDGKEFSATLGTKIDKKSLYGFAKRIVEKDGVQLSRGQLSPTGALLRSGELSLARVDPDGSLTEDPVTEIEGKPAELKPSSFDQQSELRPVPLARLVGFNVRDVYPLDDVILPEGLYETTFAYRKSLRPAEALVLAKKDGSVFLLAGVTKASTFVGQAVVYDFFDAAPAAEEESEDLDFAMM